MKKLLLVLVSLVALVGFAACTNLMVDDFLGRWKDTEDGITSYFFGPNNQYGYDDGTLYEEGTWELTDGELTLTAEFYNDSEGNRVPYDEVKVSVYEVTFFFNTMRMTMDGTTHVYKHQVKRRHKHKRPGKEIFK